MIETTQPNPQIAWSDSLWFFDIDDTLIDTAGVSVSASQGIKDALAPSLGTESAQTIQTNFNHIFQTMMSGHQTKHQNELESDYDRLIKEVQERQPGIISKFGLYKKWSREVFIKIAADRANLTISPQLVQQAADTYWQTLTDQTVVFPHALELIKIIKSHHRPIFLITSSDARLPMTESGQFSYDPPDSERQKRARIELIKNKGIDYDSLTIGDPEDKPHLDFFEKGLRDAEKFLRKPIDHHHLIMVGDSFNGDLQTPKEKLGFGLVVLYTKDRPDTKIIDDHEIHTGDLAQVANFLV